MARLLEKWGVAGNNIVELGWWESSQVNDSLEVTAAPAFHFSGRGLLDRILRAADKKNITVATPKIGQSFIYGADIPRKAWWPPIGTKK